MAYSDAIGTPRGAKFLLPNLWLKGVIAIVGGADACLHGRNHTSNAVTMQAQFTDFCAKPWRPRFSRSSGMTITTRSNLQPVRTCYTLELATGCKPLLNSIR